MDVDNTQEKQKYLRQNILQSGYDPGDFISFLQQNQNIDHIDIDGWSMAKIQQLVNAYKQYKYYTSKQNNEGENSQKKKIFQGSQKTNKNQQQKTKGSLKSITMLLSETGKMVYEKEKMVFYEEQKSKIQYPRYSPLFDYEFKGSCKGIKAQNLLPEDLRIEVPRFQVTESSSFLGLVSKTDVWYVVKSSIKKQTVVKRLIQDFDWLSGVLIKLYPFLALPQLREFSKQQQNPNEKRRTQIEEYLQSIAVRQQLHKSQLLYEFLTVHSDKMQKVKKHYDSMGFSKGVAFLKSSSGQIPIEYTKRSREFQQSCHQYSKKVIRIHEKFTQTLTKTIESMQVVVTNINSLVDYFAQLHQSYNQVMNKFPQQKSPQYNEILVNMNNLFLGLSESVKGTAFNLDKHLKEYFQLNILNDKNMIRLQKYVKEEEKIYLDYKYNLLRKKQRLVGEPDKWDVDVKSLTPEQLLELKSNKEKAYEVMLPRETQQEHEIKSWIAFLYTKFTAEFDVYVKESTWRYAKKYKLFATELLSNDKNYLEALTKFLTESRKLVK